MSPGLPYNMQAVFKGWVPKKERDPSRVRISFYDILWLSLGNHTALLLTHSLCQGSPKTHAALSSFKERTDRFCLLFGGGGRAGDKVRIWDWINFGENFWKTQSITAIVTLSPAAKSVAPSYCWKGQTSHRFSGPELFQMARNSTVEWYQEFAASCFPTRESKVPPSSLKWFGL